MGVCASASNQEDAHPHVAPAVIPAEPAAPPPEPPPDRGSVSCSTSRHSYDGAESSTSRRRAVSAYRYFTRQYFESPFRSELESSDDDHRYDIIREEVGEYKYPTKYQKQHSSSPLLGEEAAGRPQRDPEAERKTLDFLRAAYGIDASVDMNERVLAVLRRPAANAFERTRQKERLAELMQRFQRMVRHLARLIISEQGRLPEERTLQPLEGMGVLGGEKFRVGCILLKLAVAPKNVSGIDDSDAQLIAMAEVRAANAVAGMNIPNLHTPLMAVVRWRGRAVIGQAVVPIDGERTLVYGSADGGHHVVNRDAVFEMMMLQVSLRLKLASHMVGGVSLYTAGDVEGHKGTDTRYYLIDVQRLLPPNDFRYPSNFFRFFRPEFMESYRSAISADVFTPFSNDEDAVTRRQLELEAVRARDFLAFTLLPRVAAMLRADSDISTVMHAEGVNLRLLGFVYDHIVEDDRDDVRKHVACEMVLRAFKGQLRRDFAAIDDVNDDKAFEEAAERLCKVIAIPKRAVNLLRKKYFLPKGVLDTHDVMVAVEQVRQDGRLQETVERVSALTVECVTLPPPLEIDEAEKLITTDMENFIAARGERDAQVIGFFERLLDVYAHATRENTYEKGCAVIDRIHAVIHDMAFPPIRVALCETRVAAFYAHHGEYERARSLYESSLQVLMQHKDSHKRTLVAVMNALGEVYMQGGKPSEALDLFSRALAASHSPVLAHNVGLALAELGRDEEALEVLEGAAVNLAGDDPTRAVTEKCLGELHRRRGDNERALAHLERALAIEQTNLLGGGAETRSIGETLVNTGLVYRQMGDTERAMDHLERAKVIFTKLFSPEHPMIATTLINMALCLNEGQGRRQEAYAYALRARDIYLQRQPSMVKRCDEVLGELMK